MTLESVYVDANGIRLHCLKAGRDGDRAVLLVHGNSHCGGVWAPLMESLRIKGYLCFGLDLRGHGHSEKPESGYDWSNLRDDVAGVIRGLGLARPLIVAHSRGGGASLLAAAYNPGLVRGVLAFEPTTPLSRAAPPGSAEPPPALRLAQRTERRRTSFPGREFLFDYYRQRDIFRHWREDYLRALIEHGTAPVEGGIERLCPAWVEGKLYEAMLDEGPWLGVTNETTPVRLIFGENSGRLGPGRDPSRPVRTIFPQVQTEVMSGATHFGPMERPDEFERLILDFDSGLT
ncbi:MAG TPA: alpha/beta hydrolase [Dehalococcoidia bacterium]|nr:alpha/beta hydrolase [Dehalococcoidia bacterium]